MVMTNFLQKRRTVREFAPTKLSKLEMEWLRDTLDKIEAESKDNDVSFALYEDGESVAKNLDGKAGYGGVMIKAPYYIALRANYGLFDLFSSIRFAPSHINAQPWRFLLKDDGTVTLYMDKSKGVKSYVDIGVVMYYFEAMLESTGTHKTWTLIEGADVDNLEPVATISI